MPFPFDPVDRQRRDERNRVPAPTQGLRGAAFWAAILLGGLIVLAALKGDAPDPAMPEPASAAE